METAKELNEIATKSQDNISKTIRYLETSTRLEAKKGNFYKIYKTEHQYVCNAIIDHFRKFGFYADASVCNYETSNGFNQDYTITIEW